MLFEKNNIFEYSANGLYGHPYSALILKWFTPQGYLEFYPDLQVLMTDKYDYEALVYHFVNTGFHERRIYCPNMLRYFNPDGYLDYCNKKEKLLSQDQLYIHWLYEGVFKGYAGSCQTDAALNSPIQIWNIGRVGSYSIIQAIEKCGVNNLIHTHTDFEFSRSYYGSCLSFTQIMELRLNLESLPPLFIISGVRDPINWIRSSISRYVDLGSSDDLSNKSPFLFETIRGRIHWMLNFFKNPLFDEFKIFGNSFNTTKGYALYEFGKHKLLIYRLDKIGSIKSSIGDLIGYSNLNIEIINQSSLSAVSNLSNPFWCNIINDDLIEEIQKSDYMKYFFTTQEQNKIYL